VQPGERITVAHTFAQPLAPRQAVRPQGPPQKSGGFFHDLKKKLGF